MNIMRNINERGDGPTIKTWHCINFGFAQTPIKLVQMLQPISPFLDHLPHIFCFIYALLSTFSLP